MMKMTKLLHSGMISPRDLLLQWFIILGCLATALPALSADLPLSITPSVAKPKQTITVTGTGFQPGAKGLVWGGGLYVKCGVDTPDATGMSVENGYAYMVNVYSGLRVFDLSTPLATDVAPRVGLGDRDGY
jgi:hypothetical protein